VRLYLLHRWLCFKSGCLLHKIFPLTNRTTSFYLMKEINRWLLADCDFLTKLIC
jgi:hypothetical protein